MRGCDDGMLRFDGKGEIGTCDIAEGDVSRAMKRSCWNQKDKTRVFDVHVLTAANAWSDPNPKIRY